MAIPTHGSGCRWVVKGRWQVCQDIISAHGQNRPGEKCGAYKRYMECSCPNPSKWYSEGAPYANKEHVCGADTNVYPKPTSTLVDLWAMLNDGKK